MDRYVDIWKAARLAGVTRAELQTHVADGLLPSFEGRIDVSDLHRLYPHLDRGRPGMLEFVEQVKEDALRKGVRRPERPGDVSELAEEVVALRRERDHFRSLSDDRQALLDDLERMLDELAGRVEPAWPVRNLVLWLRGRRG